jgi:hypothetical protein
MSDPYSTHQTFLKHYIENTSGDIVEFGIGGSTGFILNLIKNSNRKLISIENNKDWYDKIISQYPPSNKHEYHFVYKWDEFILNMEKIKYSIVFIDQSPWEARVTSLNHFKDVAEYIIIHDVDYYPNNNIFGKHLFDRLYDFSDIFESYGYYLPENISQPPTLVGSNTKSTIYHRDLIIKPNEIEKNTFNGLNFIIQ